jgi:hypothetical protein
MHQIKQERQMENSDLFNKFEKKLIKKERSLIDEVESKSTRIFCGSGHQKTGYEEKLTIYHVF